MAVKLLPIQFSVPVEARKDLRRLALDISDDIVPDGELRYTEMCACAALYLLTCDQAEVKRIIRAGMVHEEKYGASESAPVKPPINAARVWEAPLAKPGDADVQGLDGDRPAARKVRKSPRRK